MSRSLFARRAGAAVVAAVALAASGVAVPGTAGAEHVLSTRFRVLRPDGTPAAGAVVVTSLYSGIGWQSVVGDDGWTVAGVALDAPPVVEALSGATKLLDTLIEVFDGYGPGDDEGHYLVLSARLNAGDPDLPAATYFNGVEGATFTMTEQVLELSRAPVPGPPPNWTYDDCANSAFPGHPRNAPVYSCFGFDRPVEIGNTPVPVGPNWGGGVDMTTEVEITHTKFVSTTIAMEVGAGLKPVEVKGKHSITTAKDHKVTWTWDERGGDGAAWDMYQGVGFWRAAWFTCWNDYYVSDGWTCTPAKILYPPYGPVSQIPDEMPEYGYHDHAGNPANGERWDCTIPVTGTHSTSKGETRSQGYAFKANASPKWHEFSLHADAAWTGETTVGEQSKYVWRITETETKQHHHLFVPGGMSGVTANLQGAQCPTDSPGSTYTAAADVDLSNPPIPGRRTEPPVQPVIGERYTCEVHPEKCKVVTTAERTQP